MTYVTCINICMLLFIYVCTGQNTMYFESEPELVQFYSWAKMNVLNASIWNNLK